MANQAEGEALKNTREGELSRFGAGFVNSAFLQSLRLKKTCRHQHYRRCEIGQAVTAPCPSKKRQATKDSASDTLSSSLAGRDGHLKDAWGRRPTVLSAELSFKSRPPEHPALILTDLDLTSPSAHHARNDFASVSPHVARAKMAQLVSRTPNEPLETSPGSGAMRQGVSFARTRTRS